MRGVLENEHTPLLENEHTECSKTSIPKIFHLSLLYYRDYRERKPEKLSFFGRKKEKNMKIEDRDRLNIIRGIARSIEVITDQAEVINLAYEMIETIDRILDRDRPLMIKEEGK